MIETTEKIRSPYLKEKLIAYIGNKRRLLPFIGRTIGTLMEQTSGMTTFLDLFAGSGSVSRLARHLGFSVHANDWEYYSYVMNHPHLSLVPGDEEKLFANCGGLIRALERLNTTPDLPHDDWYIAGFYAPADDENPDTRNERMFYTNHNARRIDAIRTEIERWRTRGLIDRDGYLYLLASLIYEAATHANTSGVFKGFHNGFGGRGKDALGRIFGDVALTPLTLHDGPRGNVSQMDANMLVREHAGGRTDIAYIDPPYNQHQYGSNYHLLNTIALWDKPTVNRDIYVNGKKTNKSAIRHDWIKTRSGYCSRSSAEALFSQLITSLNARYIMVSYSTDGIIPVDSMMDILNARGEVSIESEQYTRYRGAKQSIVNRTKNIEYLFIVDTKKHSTANSTASFMTDTLRENIRLALHRTFCCDSDTLVFTSKALSLTIELAFGLHAKNSKEIMQAVAGADRNTLTALHAFIHANTATDVPETIARYLRRLSGHDLTPAQAATLAEPLPMLYNKVNGRRGKPVFADITQEFCSFFTEWFSRGGNELIPCALKIIAVARKSIQHGMAAGDTADFLKHQIAGIEAYIRSKAV
ncbi:MAG: DNA adenine methylase [Spirochaetes bacterium]|nr:DNA adenine methylase [Spirochaetota bacterium]